LSKDQKTKEPYPIHESTTMGHRRERLDNRLEKQKLTREKNSGRKARERVRREARLAARAERRGETK